MDESVISKVTLFITANKDKRYLGIIMFLNIEDFCEENYMLEKNYSMPATSHICL